MYAATVLIQGILAIIFIIIVSLVVVTVLTLGTVFIVDLLVSLRQRIKRGVKK